MLSKGKIHILKYGFMLLLVGLIIGMASTAFGMTIGNIETEIQSDGTVRVTANLTGADNGDQVTILVTDYGAQDMNSAIKYIDQVAYVSDNKVEFTFKMKQADLDYKKIYRLAIGGTDVNSPKVGALFKLAPPQEAWIVGPDAVQKGSSGNYEVKVVDAAGKYINMETSEIRVEWSIQGGNPDGIAINNGVLTVGENATVESVTVVAKVEDLPEKTKKVKITEVQPAIIEEEAVTTSEVLVSKDPEDNTTSPIRVEKRPSGAFVAKVPAVAGTPFTITAPDAGGNAYYRISVKKGNSTVYEGGNFGGARTLEWNIPGDASGTYIITIETSSDGNTPDSEVKIYVSVAPTKQTILDKTLETGAAAFTAQRIQVTSADTNNNQMKITVLNPPPSTKFRYYLLPKGSEAEESKWIMLSDYTPDSSITVAKPPAGVYLISVYAKNDYSADYVDTFRMVTITVHPSGDIEWTPPEE